MDHHQQLMELAVLAASSGIAVVNNAGTVLFANPALHVMFGYEPGALAGLVIDALLPKVRTRRDALDAESWPTPGSGRIDRRAVEASRCDGRRFLVDLHLEPAMQAGEPVVLASVLDCTQRDGLEEELRIVQALDRALVEIAAGFIRVSDDEIDEHIVDSQGRLAALLGAARSSLWQADEGGELRYTHVWSSETTAALPPAADLTASEHFPWVIGRLEARELVTFASLDEIPDPRDRASYQRIDTKSGVVIPLESDQRLLGCLTFATVTRARRWDAATLERLRLIGSVMAHALARREARRALDVAHAELQRLRDQLAVENVQLRKEVHALKGPRMLSAQSSAARDVMSQIEQVAPTPATVLLLGETGSGKEVFAEALHELSPRRHRRMVRVNCAAIPSALIESELFGRERGAYTGAISRQLGRFELANQSTIFLDEIGELPLDVQVKLLRVLQDKTIERLGSPQQIVVDVRVIAATNRDLEQAIADRTFREDLYYRLNVFPVRVPPLRERREDIPGLAWSFINEFSTAFGKNIESLSRASLQALQAYSWPGNIRELRNVVERAVIVASGPQLVIDTPRSHLPTPKRHSLKFVDVEVDHIRAVLDSTGWRIRGSGGAADVLGMKPTTLESRMAKLGIVRSAKVAEPLGHRIAEPHAPHHSHEG